MFTSGIPIKIHNTTQQYKDYYVSYNDYDIEIYGGDTTALVHEIKNRFYILMGDHRSEYAARQTFDDCMEYFLSQPKETISSYSDHPDKDRAIEAAWAGQIKGEVIAMLAAAGIEIDPLEGDRLLPYVGLTYDRESGIVKLAKNQGFLMFVINEEKKQC